MALSLPKSDRALLKSDRELIAGLAKGLAIIEAFETARASLTVSRAAELTGLSRAAARRCLRTLQKLGYAQAHDDQFALAPRTLRLSQAYVVSNALPRIVQPIIEAMSQRMRHSMTVSVLDGAEVTVIARTLVHRVLAGGMALGTRLPAYCSANGRIMLSELPETEVRSFLQNLKLQKRTPFTKTSIVEILKELRAVRTQGYAINDQEVELGVRSIAMPIRNRQGVIICAVSMAAPFEISDRRYLVKMLPDLEAARRRIMAAL
jgi:IclR family transcriptional regulator, pca regulon regulatory protein